MKTIIHVNQHKIRSNLKTGALEPVLSVRTYKSLHHAHEVVLRGPDGDELARVVYRPDKPLSCGARVWIETTNAVELVVHDEDGRGERI